MGAGTSSQQVNKEQTEAPRTSRSTRSSQSNAKPKARIKGTARSSRDGSKRKTRSHPPSADESDADDNLHELERTLNSLDLGVLGNNIWEDGEYSANSLRVLRASEKDRRSNSEGRAGLREDHVRDNRSYSDGVRAKKKIKMRTHKYSWEQRPQGKRAEPVKTEEDWQYQKVVKPVADKEEENVIEPEKLIPDDGYNSLSYEKTPTYDFVEQKLLASIERETGFLD